MYKEIVEQLKDVMSEEDFKLFVDGEKEFKLCLIKPEKVTLGVSVEKRDNSEELMSFSDANFEECPSCGSSNVEFDADGLEPEGAFVYRVHRCRKCWTEWEERYDIVKVQIRDKS